MEDCLIRLPIGFSFQPARVVSHPAAVLDGQSCTSSESQVPLRFSGQKPPVNAPSSSPSFIASFALGLCTLMTLCYIHPSVSREIAAAIEEESTVKI